MKRLLSVRSRAQLSTIGSSKSWLPSLYRPAPVNRRDMASILDGTHHFIRGGDGVFEMYQINTDPREEHNLAGTPGLVTMSSVSRQRFARSRQ